VVIGFIETHGRARTQEAIGTLETLPRITVDYRGTKLSEMDVDAVLARHPQVALIDELAHTNAPGVRHHKRWEDIEDIRDAGIDVITKTGYTQPQEFAADQEGVKIMTAAGYDPHSYLRFLQRLEQLQGSAAGGQLMSTHPGISERVKRVAEQIAAMNNPGGAILADRFAKSVNPAHAEAVNPQGPK